MHRSYPAARHAWLRIYLICPTESNHRKQKASGERRTEVRGPCRRTRRGPWRNKNHRRLQTTSIGRCLPPKPPEITATTGNHRRRRPQGTSHRLRSSHRRLEEPPPALEPGDRSHHLQPLAGSTSTSVFTKPSVLLPKRASTVQPLQVQRVVSPLPSAQG